MDTETYISSRTNYVFNFYYMWLIMFLCSLKNVKVIIIRVTTNTIKKEEAVFKLLYIHKLLTRMNYVVA